MTGLCEGGGISASADRHYSADRHNIFSLGAFCTLGHSHFDFLTFAQGAASISHNRGVMDKNILATRLLNKTKSLFVIKPFDGAFYLLSHISLL